jgi:multicomponent Na+:H+ antiporter subunit B
VSSRSAIEHARQEPQAGEEKHRWWLGLAFTLAVGAVFVVGFTDLPREGASLPAVARHAMQIALPVWGQNEVVSEIVYGSRGFDTFGETFLLLGAVVAVTTLARPREPRAEYIGEASAGRDAQSQYDRADGDGDDDGGGSESQARRAEREESEDTREAPADADQEPLGTRAPERAVAMTVVVRLGARIAAVILAVASIYLAAWGYTPGGGFPAGAAIAGVVILLYAAFGHRAVSGAVRPGVLEPIELLGASAIIAIGLFGLLFKGSMFANFLTLAQPGTIRAGGTNQLYSGSELVEVATGLIIAIFSLLGMRHDWAADDADGEDDGDGDGGGTDDTDGAR